MHKVGLVCIDWSPHRRMIASAVRCSHNTSMTLSMLLGSSSVALSRQGGHASQRRRAGASIRPVQSGARGGRVGAGWRWRSARDSSGVILTSAGALPGFLARWLGKSDEAVAEEAPPKVEMEVRAVGEGDTSVEDAVLVLGATGRTGRLVVQRLLASGRAVVCAERRPGSCAEMLDGMSGFVVRGGVDVCDTSTLGPNIFAGVSQVVLCLGPKFGRLPDGSMGYIDNLTSERVDYEGVKNVAEAAALFVTRESAGDDQGWEADGVDGPTDLLGPGRVQPLAPLDFGAGGVAPGDAFVRLDDVIMGGQSSSGMRQAGVPGSGATYAVWEGELVHTGGGFCGTRTAPGVLDSVRDMSAYDGLRLRVRAGPDQAGKRRFKVNIKTKAMEGTPEAVFQASFDVPESRGGGGWVDVDIPFEAFSAVKRAKVDYKAEMPVLDPAQRANIASIGLVYSRFEYNGAPNPRGAPPGPFRLDLSCISAYSMPRPAIVLVTSAGVERNALLETEEERRCDFMPIVQLNPGGCLNYKFGGEVAVRGSGLPYTVIRPTGLTEEEGPFLLEAQQGDNCSGGISREEVADVVVKCINGGAAAVNKTMEVRRSPNTKGTSMGPANWRRLLLSAVADADRQAVGLLPMPSYREPPPPVSEKRKAEILADPRVQAAAERNRKAQEGVPEEATR